MGLGEIKVVEINHEDLGHDHVSHLDILAVQEGKHFHSHNHQHSHNHLNSENQTVTSISTKRNHKCDPEKETIELSVKSDDKHIYDRNHRLCHHHCLRHHLDHNTTRHFPNDSITHSERGEPSHEPSTETNKTQEQSESKMKGKRKRKGKKSNENSEVITPGFPLTLIRANSMSIIGSTNLIVYITQAILMYVFQNIMVMILVMDTKILILIMKVNFDILEREKHRMLKKVQFIQLLVTKIIMKMTGNMSV